MVILKFCHTSGTHQAVSVTSLFLEMAALSDICIASQG